MTEAAFWPGNADDIAYGAAATPGTTSGLTVSIIADRPRLREEMREDAMIAGLRVAEARGLEALSEGAARPRGDLVLIDCPAPGAAALAGLARLDMQVARSGVWLVVATSVAALEDVFGVLDQSEAQILVAPSRAERAIALGQALARGAGRKVRELSEEDRMVLIRLTNQVSQIAERMDRLSPESAGMTPLHGEHPAFRLDGARGAALQDARDVEAASSGAEAGQAGSADGGPAMMSPATPASAPAVNCPLPDPRLVRRIIRQRQQRARYFDADLFADPAWDMLLDLTAAHVEQIRISVTSLCIASGVPPTTALRWIGQMTRSGWLRRVEDRSDRRRAFVTLTERAAAAMSRYFAELGAGGGAPVT